MNPIAPTGATPSQAAALQEAVLRYGGTQEIRDVQRREKAADMPDDDAGVPVDVSDDVDLSDVPDLPEAGNAAAPSQGSRAGESGRAHRHHAEESVSHHAAPGQDGLEQQREQALAQHAAEQHGRQENHRDGAQRLQRSTREMMHLVEGATAVTDDAPETAPAASSSAAGASSDVSADSEDFDPSAGGDPAPAPQSGAGVAPRVSGEVLAAAVGSGIRSAKEIAPEARVEASDRGDDVDNQIDGSQQATGARTVAQGKKSTSRTHLESHLGFGGQTDGGERDSTRGQGGYQDSSQRDPERSAVPRTTGEEAETASAPVDHLEQVPAAPVPAQSVAAAVDVQPAPIPAAPPPPAEPPDKVERVAVLSPGVDLTSSEEYFFFDDARYDTGDAVAS